MNDLPPPPVPSDVDVRGFSGFMLDVDRLLASELVALATPEEAWCALMLWCRAWQQHPAGSLPNDERVLAAFSRAGTRWKKVRDMALRGFVLCSDGRLYHPVMVEQVMSAWAKRKAYRNDQQRLKNWREKRKAEGEGLACETPQEAVVKPVSTGVSETSHETPQEPYRQRQGQGQGQEERKKEGELHSPPRAPRARACRDDPDFAAFYAAYPRKDAPDDALKAWRQVTRDGAKPADIMAGLAAYQFPADGHYTKFPASWLRAGCWKGQAAAPSRRDERSTLAYLDAYDGGNVLPFDAPHTIDADWPGAAQ